MSQIGEQITQCKKDIESLQKNLAKLEEKKVQTELQAKLRPGDVAENDCGRRRLIVRSPDGRIFSVDVFGKFQSWEQDFKDQGYEKIGYITDFIGER